MIFSQKWELLKKLETLIILQGNCLQEGNWDHYDEIENEIKKLEDRIVCPINED